MRRLALPLLLAALATATGASGEAPRARRVPPEVLAAISDDDAAPLPRSLARGERVPTSLAWRLPLAPPAGQVHTPPEYTRNRGLLIRWGSFNSVLTEMTVAITTGDPDATVWILVSGASQQSSATSTLAAAGADLAGVEFLVAPTDSVWIRDYGPRFIEVDKAPASVDHDYNRPRPFDDAVPDVVAAAWGHTDYDLPLVHGGGNFHLFGDGRAWMTDLVLAENGELDAAGIAQLFADYENLDLAIWSSFPASYDATQHIDMWLLPVRDRVAIVGEYEASEGGGVPRAVSGAMVDQLEGLGYTVFRTPGWRSDGTHYTYANAVVLNRLVLVPQFDGWDSRNQQALVVFAQAFPGHQIVPIDATLLVTFAGVLHCIVMHVPDPAFLSWDDFETGDTSTWSLTVP